MDARIIIPTESNPKDVTEALAKYIVSHSTATGRWLSSVSDEIKTNISHKAMRIELETCGLHEDIPEKEKH